MSKTTPRETIPAPTGAGALTAQEAAGLLRRGTLSAPELLDAALTRIRETDDTVRAFITVLEEPARQEAEAAQRRIDAARRDNTLDALPALTGIPVALKDNICVRGQKTTCGSRILETHVPMYDATVTRKLRDAGAVLLGKTNMDEFAMGSTTETSRFPATRNPADLSRSPGGSSGGSAAAVAAFQTPLALGSDTGGSIRQPASFCGITGLKPTYGAVSRYGLVAFASSLDQIGPMGRTVRDVADLFEAVRGEDPHDGTSEPLPLDRPDFDRAERDRPLDGVRIGMPEEYFGDGLDAGVRAAVERAASVLTALGAVCEPCSLPVLAYGVPAYYIVACAEASSNLARYDGIKYGYRAAGAEDLADLYVRTRSEGFGLEAKRRIMLGNFVLSSGYYDAYYSKAMGVRARLIEDLSRTFGTYDLLLGPVAPSTAPVLGESLDDPLKMYLGDLHTVAASLAGLPALSVPCGEADGLPVGMQLIGPKGSEAALLTAGHCYERAVSV